SNSERVIVILQSKIGLSQSEFRRTDHFQAIGNSALHAQLALSFQRILKAFQSIVEFSEHRIPDAHGLKNICLVLFVPKFASESLRVSQIVKSRLRVAALNFSAAFGEDAIHALRIQLHHFCKLSESLVVSAHFFIHSAK